MKVTSAKVFFVPSYFYTENLNVTLHVTGLSTNSCIRVEMAGSSTKGTKKRNAKMLTIHNVPRTRDV